MGAVNSSNSQTEDGAKGQCSPEGAYQNLKREGSFQTIIEKYYQWDYGVLEVTEEADKRSGTFILWDHLKNF